MDLSVVLVILILAILGFVVILKKPKTNDKNGLDTPLRENTSVKQTFPNQNSSSVSSSGGGSSLLNQLSMINARSFPALSTTQLPNKVPAFFGRKDTVLEVAGRSWNTGGPISLYGNSGAGKTTLALELAHELKPKFPDAQFYIDLKGPGDKPLSVSKAMGFVLRAFFPKEAIPHDPAELLQKYGTVLQGKKVLMLIENVSKASQVKRLMPTKSGLVIFTSEKKVSIPGSYSKHIKELYPDEAELLLSFWGKNTKRWATELAELCGFSPLAIAIAGSFLKNNPDYSPETLVRALKEGRRVLKPEGEEEFDRKKNKQEILDRNVEPIFNIIFKDLRKETATVYRKLALFASSFDDKAVASICGDRDGDHLGRLVSLKLIEYDSINKRYFFHELIHKLIKPEVRPSEKILTNRNLAFYYFDILKNANELYKNDEEALESALNIFDLDWLNIQAGQKWAAQKSTEDAKISKLCGDYCIEARELMPMRHPADECIEWNESALTASRESENVEAQKNNLLSLGLQLHSLGFYDKAAEYLEEAQALANKLGHVSDEKVALDLLGQCCLGNENFEKAIECFARVLEIVRLEGNANKEIETLSLLGKACFEANNLERAELNFKLALDKAKKVDNKKFQAKILDDLGCLSNSVKKYQSAITFFKEGRNLAKQCDLKIKEMDILENLSISYQEIDKNKKALESLNGSFDIAKKMGDNRRQGLVLKKMGDFHQTVKEYSKAIDKYERGLPKIRKYSTYPNEYSTLENLGISYLELERYEKAQICFRHARTLGKKNTNRFMEAKSMWNLSISYQKSGEESEALTNAEIASQICSRVENNADINLLAEEVKEWMIKRVEGEIKESGL